MEPTNSDNWRSDGAVTTQYQTKSETSNKESWNSERGGPVSGRRMSDGAPAPLNRIRSFKGKQLVRSQAIRESQSPPRMPSPGQAELTDKNKMASVKKKSLSMDSDDRNNSDDSKVDLCVDRKPIILKKNNVQKNLDTCTVAVSKQSVCDNIVGANSKVDNNIYCDKVNASQKILNKVTDDSMELGKQKDSNNVTKTPNTATSNNFKQNYNNNNIEIEKNQTTSKVQTKENSEKVDTKSMLPSQFTTDRNINNNCINVTKAALGGVTKEPLTKQANLADTKQTSFNKSHDHDNGSIPRNESPTNRGNGAKVEFQQVEIQVTSGDYDTNLHDRDTLNYPLKGNKRCDCMSFDEEKEKDQNSDVNSWKGKRATCPSKQDSGVCCWEQCQCCGDLSPDSNASIDADDDSARFRRPKQSFGDHDVHHQSIDNCRCQDRFDRWPHRRSGSTLTVQRASSGGNPRLLRKQSSGGSVDSGQHSIASPYLSRDNSTELMTGNSDSVDLNQFVKDTLNKSYKDRINLLKIEQELINLVKDPNRNEHRFQQPSSYGRLLIHRCAELFGLKHCVDGGKQCVFVTKPAAGSPQCKIPLLSPFEQWCFEKFLTNPNPFPADHPLPAKSILKRDAHSLDDEGASLQASRPTLRSKSFEQREEEYSKARQRIFNSSELEEQWKRDEENKRNQSEMEHCKPQLLLPENDRMPRAARLVKVQSLENQETVRVTRGVVSKAHSFGGYGDRPNVTRQDSCVSTNSAPPTRILSHKGELASSNWRLSPGNSSGYRTLSARSDSITPSPTPTCGDTLTTGGGVLWAITDMSSVPIGAVIIHPQTGQPLTNNDGSIYHYDPVHPPNLNLLNTNQVSTEGVRVLTNPERRRSRLEKQRATLSPNNDADLLNEKTKLNESDQHSVTSNTLEVPEEMNFKPKDNVNIYSEENNSGDNEAHTCHCDECEAINIENNVNADQTNIDDMSNNDENVEEIQAEGERNDIVSNKNTISRNEESSDTNIVNEMPCVDTNVDATKMLEQVVAAEYYMPSENYIYGSGYENLPEMVADPNLLDQTLQLENATAIQPCISSISNIGKQEYIGDNINREMGRERRQENDYNIVLGPYSTPNTQEFYEQGIHTIGPYPNTSYDNQNTEIPPYPNCCGPVLMRAPPGGMYPQQPYILPLPMPPSYVPASNSTILPSSTAQPPPQPQPHLYHGWGWPTMVYTPQPSIPHPAMGEIPKVPTHGSYMPQANDGSMQASTGIPQTFYPHGPGATVLMTQPPPCFQYPQQSAGLVPIPHTQQPIYHSYPLYQYPIPGRSSVVSVDGSTTSGYHNFENVNLTQQFSKTQEDPQKMWNNNSRSPKNILSREHSHPGSSRATPLMNVQQYPAGSVCYEGFPGSDQINTIQFHTNPYAVQQHRQHNEQTNPSTNYYTKKYANDKPITNMDRSNFVTLDKNISKVDNKVEKSLGTPTNVHQAKSLDNYSNENKTINDKTMDKRKTYKSSSTSINCQQESFDQGNYNKDKTGLQTTSAPSIVDNHFPALSSKFKKSMKFEASASLDNDANKCATENSSSKVKDAESCCGDANLDKLTIEEELKRFEERPLPDFSKELAEVARCRAALEQYAVTSKHAMRENNVKSYLNFPKPRHNNFHKQTYYRDDREPNKYFNKEHTPNYQASQSAWVLENSESPQLNKISTTTPSTAPSVNVSTKPYGDKPNNQNGVTKNYTKKDHNVKEAFTAPSNGTCPTSQEAVQQQLSNTMSTNAFNKSIQRVNKTPPIATTNNNNSFNQSNTPVVDRSGVVRTQFLQTLGGVSLFQTPPQTEFYLRQIQGWMRRPQGHSIFGSPPPIIPHVRGPRPPRGFANNINYRQR